MGGNVAEEATGHCHQQRGRHALARYVAHREVEFLIIDKEIIQVAAYFLGRDQAGIQVNILPVGERREDFRNHAHLDIAGNAQLAFDAFLTGGGLFQLFRIGDQRLLHEVDGIAQHLHFVLAPNIRQSGLEVARRNLLRRGGKLHQRGGLPAHYAVTAGKHDNDSHNKDDDDLDFHLLQSGKDFVLRTNDAYRPAGTLNRCIKGIAQRVIVLQQGHALLLVNHGAADIGHRLVFHIEGGRKDRLIQDAFGKIVHQVGSAPPHHDVV